MKFSVFQLSDPGGRPRNEDRMGYCYTSEAALFLVADGMGGHSAGDVAAQLSLQTISAYFQKQAKPRISRPEQFLVKALMAAHDELTLYTLRKGLPDAPRTTVAMVLVQDGQVSWLHCGDSRVYCVRQQRLLARTKDHSYAERQAELSKGVPLSPHNRNVLFTCVGGPEVPVYDLRLNLKLEQADKVLLCSDGLWDSLSDELIVQMLSAHKVSQAVPKLVRQAVLSAQGPSDNVTALAFEWELPNAEPNRIQTKNLTLSTDELNEGVFASTIQNVDIDEQQDDLDESSIEKSIQEINAAIARTRKS
jgi:PPM family protein phosphatase